MLGLEQSWLIIQYYYSFGSYRSTLVWGRNIAINNAGMLCQTNQSRLKDMFYLKN